MGNHQNTTNIMMTGHKKQKYPRKFQSTYHRKALGWMAKGFGTGISSTTSLQF
jgi:hypothetical protein